MDSPPLDLGRCVGRCYRFICVRVRLPTTEDGGKNATVSKYVRRHVLVFIKKYISSKRIPRSTRAGYTTGTRLKWCHYVWYLRPVPENSGQISWGWLTTDLNYIENAAVHLPPSGKRL